MLPYFIEHANKGVVALPIDGGELEQQRAQFSKHGGQKEIGPAVLCVEEGAHVPVPHDRGQLEEIPTEHDLDPTKWGSQVLSLDAQGPIRRVHDIGSDHGNLVNDEGLQGLK